MSRGVSREFPDVQGPGWVIIDTETTGLSSEARVIEIAVVLLSPSLRVEESFSTLLRGDGTVGNGFARRKHRISESDLIGAPPFRTIAGPLLQVLSQRVPVVHNEGFDLRLINHELRLIGRRPISRFGCTLALGSEIGFGRLKLGAAIQHFGLNAVNSHQAEDDALATAQLLKYYAKRYRSHVVEHVESCGYRLPR